MTALTLLSIAPMMVAAIDVSGGVREESEHKHFTMSEADPTTNHLDITAAGRSDCISAKALARSALSGGTGCNTMDETTCPQKYEEKSREGHRVGETWSASVSLVGEVHLCEWRTAAQNGNKACMAGKTVTVCPEEEVVETSAVGGAATASSGSSTNATAVSAASTSSAAGTPNTCSQSLAVTSFAAGTATVITTGKCEDTGLCTPTQTHCEAAAASIGTDNGRGPPSFGAEDRSGTSTCALCSWWADSETRTGTGGRRRHRTLLEYTFNAATGYNDCGATTGNGADAGCVCVPC